MFIEFVVNWKMNLFTSLLFVSALNSCSVNRTNLYEAWCLEQQSLQVRSRQIVKREIRLPDWYRRLHSILSGLRSLSKIDKETILSALSVVFLVSGVLCLSLGYLLIKHQMNKDETDPTSGWYWFASLKGNAKTTGIEVVISVLSDVAAGAVHKSVVEISIETPKQMCASIENGYVAKVAEVERSGRKEQQLRSASLRQGILCVKQRKNNKQTIGYPAEILKRMRKFYKSLSEKDRRRYAGVEALKLEQGGITYIARLLGCDRKTVRKGITELKKMSKRHVDQHRIRKRGGGRKPYARNKKLAHIDNAFLDVLKNNTAGDPMREEVIWTNLTPNDICQFLFQKHNIQVSPTIVRQLLKKHEYRRRQMLKKKIMKHTPIRNQQFVIIGQWKESYQKSPNPIISIDSKKKEHLGNFYRSGRLYTREAIHCYDHDYPSFAHGIIIPRGLYDIKRNKGFIHLGTGHDTSEFACDCLRDWWLKHGRYDYPDADSILVLCDGGGSNSSRHYIFKQDLRKLVTEIGIEIRIAHYPPYCSKYNPIEHRLFPHVTRACQGVVFESVELVKSLMEKTKTRTGLTVDVSIIDKFYETGRKASDDFRRNMGILFDETLPRLNYRALPNGEVI